MICITFASILLAVYFYCRSRNQRLTVDSMVSPPALTRSLNSDFFENEEEGLDKQFNFRNGANYGNTFRLDTEESETESEASSDRIDLTR